jgi:hypothetical protein
MEFIDDAFAFTPTAQANGVFACARVGGVLNLRTLPPGGLTSEPR